MSKFFWGLTCLLLLNVCAFAQTPFPDGRIGNGKLYYGVSYYPEAWDTTLIDEDIKRMKATNMNVVRMAEFAWAKMEPQEGRFDFRWLQNVIRKLDKAGIAVIVGTPSATPPAWMWEKYPEIALTYPGGGHPQHGIRRDVSYSSQLYRQKCVRICEEMAKSVGGMTGVIAWQTDNEMSLMADYSEETKKRWHDWLRNKYQTVEALNKAWATDLWSMRYDKFEQVVMPVVEQWYSPSIEINWMRFCSDEVVGFQQVQIDAIRKHSKLPITHDATPNQRLLQDKLFRPLDFCAINNYHSFEAYDLVFSNYERQRGLKNQRYFWLFETAPNFSGGGNNGSTWFLHQPEGSMKAALWMSYAMGSQGSMFWLWRQQASGQEMTHGAVLHSWGRPTANYKEIQELGAEVKKASDFLTENPVAKAEVGIVYDNDNSNGLSIENTANDINYYKDWTNRFYLPLVWAGIHREIIPLSADFSSFKTLFIPLCPMLTSEVNARLADFVNKGGSLIIGPMTGYRDDEMKGMRAKGLGELEQWIGFTTGARLPIGASPRPAEKPFYVKSADKNDTARHRALLWAENYVVNRSDEVLMRYTGMYLKDSAAIIRKKVGLGTVTVLGTDPGKEVITKLVNQVVKDRTSSPKPVEGLLYVPRQGRKKGGVAVNLTGKTLTLLNCPASTDIITGKKVKGALQLGPYEYAVLREDI